MLRYGTLGYLTLINIPRNLTFSVIRANQTVLLPQGFRPDLWAMNWDPTSHGIWGTKIGKKRKEDSNKMRNERAGNNIYCINKKDYVPQTGSPRRNINA